MNRAPSVISYIKQSSVENKNEDEEERKKKKTHMGIGRHRS